MDNGVRFVLDNFEKAIHVCECNNEYRHLKRKIITEYNLIKHIRFTGNMVEHFDKFKGNVHKYAGDFEFLNKYNVLTNEQLSEYLRSNYKDELENRKIYKDVQVGDVLSHAEILILFGGNRRGAAIRRNKDKNIFTLVLNDIYNEFDYENGMVRFNYHGNNTNFDESKYLFQYKKLNAEIHVFRAVGKNRYEYFGQVDIIGEPYISNNRKCITLKRIESSICKNILESRNVIRYLTIDKCQDAKLLGVPNDSEIQRCKAQSASRNQKVSSYTKHRANGKCDLCGKKAPFYNEDGQPFLECHHVIYIANNGPDRIYNTVALCPNCHREVHELGDGKTKEKLINKIREYLANDKDNLERFNDLFGFKK